MGGRCLAFYIRGSRIFVWEGGGGRSSVLTLFVDILSPQYIVVQRGLYFDFARLWPLLIVLKLY